MTKLVVWISWYLWRCNLSKYILMRNYCLLLTFDSNYEMQVLWFSNDGVPDLGGVPEEEPSFADEVDPWIISSAFRAILLNGFFHDEYWLRISCWFQSVTMRNSLLVISIESLLDFNCNIVIHKEHSGDKSTGTCFENILVIRQELMISVGRDTNSFCRLPVPSNHLFISTVSFNLSLLILTV